MEDTNTQTAQPVNITPTAVAELKNIRKEEQVPDHYGLRIGVKGGGWSGFSYIMGFDEKKESDEEYEIGGVRVIIDKTHPIYLLGMELDLEDDLSNRGCAFNCLSADDTCGCGTSFCALSDADRLYNI